ncbi:Mur ligase domain-containing protein [Phenylobacterium immobile]|uniref:Mur ligase domain-containing protein n=1 Tax=Phenylobacterium immobile TaxID=21 RepID=UPI000AF02B68|nr:Mur ligase domain-containing protein [Phenylobacterium immobile]
MRIHFTGIAGAGMAAVAVMMRQAGHVVSGSDVDVFPPMSTYVAGLGFPVFDGFAAEQLPADLDLLVLGASAKLGGEDNAEVAAARARGVRVTSFPELVGEQTVGRPTTVVAGSFGKSTCSGLMAHVLRSAGRDPGWLVGAIAPDLPDTGHWGTSPEVVLEGDEYIVGPADRRSKFVLYHPRDVLLTSLTHDHVNVFPNFADYEAPFRALLRLVPADGLCVLRDRPQIRRVADETVARTIWYDTVPCDGWWSDDAQFGETSAFTLHGPGDRRVRLATRLLGAHNIENIVGVAAYLLERGLVDEAGLARGVASFSGIRRRLDRLAPASTIPLIEGFGSSYEKARSAIDAMRLHYPQRRLVVVFEPHTFSWRSRDALAWYDTVFEGVDALLLVPPPGHGAASHNQASLDEIEARIAASGVKALTVATAAEAAQALSDLSGDEALLMLSSGPLLGLPETLPALFEARYG